MRWVQLSIRVLDLHMLFVHKLRYPISTVDQLLNFDRKPFVLHLLGSSEQIAVVDEGDVSLRFLAVLVIYVQQSPIFIWLQKIFKLVVID